MSSVVFVKEVFCLLFLFNVYVDELIESLSISGFGCYIGDSFLGCIMYADDLYCCPRHFLVFSI